MQHLGHKINVRSEDYSKASFWNQSIHAESTAQTHLSVFSLLSEQMADLPRSPRWSCGLISIGCRWTKWTISQALDSHTALRYSHSETAAVVQAAPPLTKGRGLLSRKGRKHPHDWHGSLSLHVSKHSICLCINSACIWCNYPLAIWGLDFLPVMKGRRCPLGVYH